MEVQRIYSQAVLITRPKHQPECVNHSGLPSVIFAHKRREPRRHGKHKCFITIAEKPKILNANLCYVHRRLFRPTNNDTIDIYLAHQH